jgi:hypothetical protein
MQPTDPARGPGVPELAAEGRAGEYEFSSQENTVIGELADKMRFVGLFLMIAGVLTLILAFVGTFARATGSLHEVSGHGGGFVSGMVNLFLGIWSRRAAASLRQIVDTRGRDISNLMNALGELLKMYQLQYWILVIALVILAVAVPVVLVGLALVR